MKKVIFSINISEDLRDKIDAEAARQERSRSWMIEKALKEKFDKADKSDK